MKTFDSKRRYPPSSLEMKYIDSMKQIPIEINFSSGGATTMQIESYTIVKDLKTAVMKKLQLNINRLPYYALYEICYKPNCIEERYLSENYKVCDILSVWEKERDEYIKNRQQINFKMILKIQLYFNYNPQDLDSVTMHYVQTNFEVIKGFYNLSSEEIIQLAAIQFYVNYGKIGENDIFAHISTELKKYIPCQNVNEEEVTADKIKNAYLELDFTNKLEAKNKYLEIMRKNELWETTQFICNFSQKYNTEYTNSNNIQNPDHIPEECIVCISPKEVLITDKYRHVVLKLRYKQLASWGVNGDLLVLVKKQDKTYNKMYFESSQSQLFKILMDSYAGMLAGKNMVDIMQKTAETCKMFETLPVGKSKNGESIRSRQSTIYSADIQ
jgi:hypothetical protein